jgi:ankyrin repeat protein
MEQKDNNGNTPLILACLLEKRDLAKALIINGANVNATGQFGWTPLMAACVARTVDFAPIVKLLLDKDADINAVTNRIGIENIATGGEGDSALNLACRLSNNPKIVDELLNRGVNRNHMGSRGTPLYECKQNPDMLSLIPLFETLDAPNEFIYNNSNVGFRPTPKNYATQRTTYNAHYVLGGRRTAKKTMRRHSKTRSKKRR